ncbi:MAG: M56 family metallopeptidase [Saprospiraceae bacterium]
MYFVEDSNYPISSFLNYIFLPNTEINPIMVEHERIHIDKQHTCDVLLASFFRCVFWFHPFSHAMIRSIKLNHEYECDALMVKRFTVEQYAQVLLSQAQSVRPNSVINQFYSFTKKRIIMLSHLQSNRKPNRNFIWMFPTFIMVFAMFSFKKYYVSIDNQNALVSATDSIPKGQQYVDTIIGMDPVTFKETITLIPKTYKITDTVEYLTTVDGTPCTSQLIASHEFPVEYYLRNIDNMVDAKDTIIVLDPETMQETIKISEYKISKLYKDMIDSELEKSEPNFKLIEKWTNEGKRNAGR